MLEVCENQDGAIRILYQSRTCNKIMQGSGHIHSLCNNEDDYDVGVSGMDFYLMGMDVYILLLQSTG